MLIEIDDCYVEWLKTENPDLFSPGQEAKVVVEEYVNDVLAGHRSSWSSEQED